LCAVETASGARRTIARDDHDPPDVTKRPYTPSVGLHALPMTGDLRERRVPAGTVI
jgi:hypothetical protein